MLHIMKYHTLALLRNKNLLFWTLIFPIALSTFLSVTVLKAYDAVEFKIIPIAVIDNEEYQNDQIFKEVMKSIGTGEDAMFTIQYVNQDEAETLMKNDDIDGYYMHKNGDIVMHVDSKDNNQIIMKTFMDEYKHKSYMVQELMMQGAQSNQIMAMFDETQSFVNEQGQSENNELGSVYFYSILAMTMLYGGYWTMRTSHNQMANQSEIAKRNNIAPTKRSVQLCADFIITISMHFIMQLILVAYMNVVLGIDFGSNLPAILGVVLIGTFAGNALGLVVSMYGSKSFESNTGILTSITMLCCVLSGMMMVQLKYYVQVYAPILAIINPANMIADALYAQYYYGLGERYMLNIISLVVFTCICYVFAYVRLRRKQYASL